MKGDIKMGLISGIVGAASSALGLAADKAKADYAWKRQKRMFDWQNEINAQKHQIEANDLIKAGFNPALTTGMSGTTSAGGGQSPTLGETSFKASSALAAINNMDKQNSLLTEQTKLATAQKNKTEVETDLLPPKAKQEIRESNARISSIENQNNEIAAKIQNLDATRTLINTQSALNETLKEKAIADKDLAEAKTFTEKVNPNNIAGNALNTVADHFFGDGKNSKKQSGTRKTSSFGFARRNKRHKI